MPRRRLGADTLLPPPNSHERLEFDVGRSQGRDEALARKRRGGRAVKISLSLDRFEGDRKQIAVLVTDDGQQFNISKGLLPKGTRPGDVLTLQIERDSEATKRIADATKAVQDDLKKRDPGGDIRL